MPREQRLEAVVHGSVQGVFFRHNARIRAEQLGLTGTVRNRPDGTVEVIAEGPRDRLEQLNQWLHQGPELAQVERVDTTWQDADESFSEFRIVR